MRNSRTGKAAINAAFGYAQYALAIVIGIGLAPLVLGHLGIRTWGLWLATGEVLAYAGMVDLGVLGVLPWLVAEADGRGDRGEMRRLVSNGFWVGALVGAGYLVLAALLWQVLPPVLRLSAADRAAIGPPLALLVAVNAAAYPLRVFPATLLGLQDMTFAGVARLVQSLLNVALTVGLLVTGHGLYALAWASAGPVIFMVAVCGLRLLQIAPDLAAGWTRPVLPAMQRLVVNGFGVWLAGFGWLFLSSSNALVIAWLGHPEWVPIFTCTARTSVMAAQMVWLLPDSGLVGLAALGADRHAASRVPEVVGILQKVHLLLAGGAACAVLAFNPSFVTRWVGAALFGGFTLNALLALGLVVGSLVHGLVTAASVLGNRVHVGMVTLANGLVQLAAALVLGWWLGLAGIALAAILAAAATTLPAGVVLLGSRAGLTWSRLAGEHVWPWMRRAVPVAAAAALAGLFHEALGFWVSGLATGIVALAYVWHMRPMYGALVALVPRWTSWLTVMKLVPVPPRVEVAALVDRS